MTDNTRPRRELPKLPEIDKAELDPRTKAVWQKKLAEDGLWDEFREAKEERRRLLRQAGFPRSEANLQAWWEVIQELDHKLSAQTMSDAEFWKYQYGWMAVLMETTTALFPEPTLEEQSIPATAPKVSDLAAKKKKP